MGKLTVSYNNNSIIDTTSDGSFTLATEGKLMADDVGVEFEGGVALTLEVTVDSGATVTATNGSQTVTGTSVNGLCTLSLPAAGTWTVSAEKDGESSGTETVSVVDTYAVTLTMISSTLNDNDWSVIRAVSDAGNGANYWSVGDRKAVTLNGTVVACTFSNAVVYAFIIGFNHNASHEGGNRIHFQFGKTALSGGKDICFVDSAYGVNPPGGGFFMNGTASNSGGWKSSYMRTTVCGTSLSSYSSMSFIAALPSALRSVLKTVTKYTDNTGGGSATASDVTATTDVIFLLADYEVSGSTPSANTNEKDYQAQYAYYSAGNRKVKYQHSTTGSTSPWWLRSPRNVGSANFSLVNTGGDVNSYTANISYGFAPAFCV